MFDSLTLIKPFWYFHLPGGERSSWPDPATLNLPIELDSKYDSRTSAILESSFLLLMKGWISKKDDEGQLSLADLNYKPDINDEFRFLRKYFSPSWCIVYLLYCIFTLKNPIRVLYGFFRSIRINRQPLFPNPIGATQLPENDGLSLIGQKEMIRVIIPTYNRYDVLHDVMKDLERQDYSYFSVTVVDQSTSYNDTFYNNYNLDIQLIRQENPRL